MRDDNLHPSDHDLLLFADGELPGRRASQVRSHLSACWHCCERLAKIESAILDFVRLHDRSAGSDLPPASGPRALLKARLAELAAASSSSILPWIRQALRPRSLAYALPLLLAAAVVAALLLHRRAEIAPGDIAQAEILPNPQLTPGATRPISLGALCSIPHDEVVRTVPSALQRQVLTEYGVPNTRAADFEVDYLITPGLGGADDIRNLWPEPHTDATWNSYVKDQLEERLHDLVCSGQLDLATAQRQIAGNWIVAYKKYFRTENPLALHPHDAPDAPFLAARAPRDAGNTSKREPAEPGVLPRRFRRIVEWNRPGWA